MVPKMQIDLFATAENHQLPLYVAPNIDQKAVGADAMSLDWNQWEVIFLFPPMNLMLKVLDKLRTFRGIVALVAPLWPKSIWFPLLLQFNHRLVPLPAPTLSQKVQQQLVFASSWLTQRLHSIVLSGSPWGEH